MEEYLDVKYVLKKSDNFDDLLIYLNKNVIERQLSATLSPVQYISKNKDGTYKIHWESALVHYKFSFTPGEEFAEKKPDGETVKSLINFDGNRILHRQIEDSGRTLNHVYEFFPDKLVLTTTAEGLKLPAIRYYELVKK